VASASGVTQLEGRILVPDFRGLTPEQVRRELSGHGVALQVSGSGRAVAQEPAPGTIVRGGSVRVRFAAAGGAR
jgi:stage V sporulation protein D (sporulation-specific penicillin-binding protein)